MNDNNNIKIICAYCEKHGVIACVRRSREGMEKYSKKRLLEVIDDLLNHHNIRKIRNMSLKLKCHSCGSKITPENPCVWLGIPTYCTKCFARIRNYKGKNVWKGIQHYKETGEEFPK